MKSLEIIEAVFLQNFLDTLVQGSGKRLGRHVHSRLDLLRTFSDDSLTWLQSIFNNPLRNNVFSYLNRSQHYFVISPHNGDLITSLQFGYRPLRHE